MEFVGREIIQLNARSTPTLTEIAFQEIVHPAIADGLNSGLSGLWGIGKLLGCHAIKLFIGGAPVRVADYDASLECILQLVSLCLG